ncbi:MAG: glutamine-hydrolyzing carbamoyl-phosphate synthase small subunit [Planctomycetota bacterium]
MKGYLALEDGRVFEGESFGASGEKSGEVVFNTSMTGYQEILTDPSYKGQIVTMTYPLIGNYGVNTEDIESFEPQVEGFVVREYCPYPSNQRSEGKLGDYLDENDIIALSEIDTRALTKHIREAGAMKAVIATGEQDPDALVDEARESPGLVGRDLVKEVTCSETYEFNPDQDLPEDAPHVVVLDYGAKYNIMRCLAELGMRVTVMPADTTAEEVLEQDPDGIMLSNGPGDPAGVPYAVEEVRDLLGERPIFGICLGHQLLGRAFGGDTYKLKFGHRGANHPVKELESGEIDITCQNHGFCVDMDTLQDEDIELTHVNLNDETLEGLKHTDMPVMSVQHHPEASAGPHDARPLFKKFKDMIEAHREN